MLKGGIPKNAELLLGVTRMAMIKKNTFQGERHVDLGGREEEVDG